MMTDRRTFLQTLSAAAVALGTPVGAAVPVRFGVDMFSLGAQNWTPFQQLDFAAKWNVKVVHFSEIRFLGSLEPEHLRRVRARADELGIELEIGMRSICPTSASFDKAQGTAEEQITRMIDAARIVRSPIVRAFLGSAADRAGGIERHIESTIAVLKTMRSRLVDAGVKVAIENHAGDMQARELKALVEGAGTDAVGVCLDSGNPVWTIEDPHLTLDTLAPYVLTSHMRDSALWNTPEGAAVRWTRMGEGNMGIESYIRSYIEKCPGRAVSLEIIVTPRPRMSNYRDPKFWDLYRGTPAWEFARFLALCDKGKPVLEPDPDPAISPAARQLANVEASIRWTQAFLATL
ncbi:MAG: sugar phosphate isomerase/epimerase [Acidobacteriota bacterium]|nr:sugar phosphate isomerase/epimerase [Acidobacteriota bacterium]